jgi:hypothetical protein
MKSGPHTHIKRQATQHDCLPSLLGMGSNEVKSRKVREKIYRTWPTGAAKAGQISLVRNNESNKPTIYCILLEPPFYPSIVSLVSTKEYSKHLVR